MCRHTTHYYMLCPLKWCSLQAHAHLHIVETLVTHDLVVPDNHVMGRLCSTRVTTLTTRRDMWLTLQVGSLGACAFAHKWQRACMLHTHTHTHTHARAHVCARTHAHTHPRMRTRTCACICACRARSWGTPGRTFLRGPVGGHKGSPGIHAAGNQ
jgi:hypothetical protein